MDRITKSLLDEFSTEQGIVHLPEDKRFEHFAAYLVIHRFYSDSFDTSDVVTGDGNDTGIDAIGIVVNGSLVTDAELIEELAETNGYLDVTFVFVQVERSAGFDTSKIGQFSFGVLDFFKAQPSLPQNEAITEAHSIMEAIYKRSGKFKRGNPACRLFYVTTGKWTGDTNLEARRKSVLADIDNLRIFREVEFTPIDVDATHKLYRQTKNAISRDFTFAERTVMPEIPGVLEAYLGFLPAQEFLHLIKDEEDNIIKSIFYDNVRDWQDFNSVNSEIRNTLASEKLRSRFALMNNGVTIIAKTLRATGNRFYIEDYQIVNGCQTSHVVFDQRELIDNSVMIPLRLIATQDDEVIASIIKATNRQTEVKEEQLLALSDFQKKIEAHFQSFDDSRKLFYERRSKQYNELIGIEKTRIITLPNLIRAYAAMFLEEPHSTTRNYKRLLDLVGKTIFESNHRLEPYHLAAFALYKLEYLFRNGIIHSQLKVARYHILLAYRLISNSTNLPRMNSHDMAKYCEAMLGNLSDSMLMEKTFLQAVTAVSDVAQSNFDRDHIRTQAFTEQLRNHLLQRR